MTVKKGDIVWDTYEDPNGEIFTTQVQVLNVHSYGLAHVRPVDTTASFDYCVLEGNLITGE